MQGLSILSRGTLEEKLCWTFSLYDINGDGQITKEEMSDIVTSIYELSNPSEVTVDGDRIKEKVDRIFQVSVILRYNICLMVKNNWTIKNKFRYQLHKLWIYVRIFHMILKFNVGHKFVQYRFYNRNQLHRPFEMSDL